MSVMTTNSHSHPPTASPMDFDKSSIQSVMQEYEKLAQELGPFPAKDIVNKLTMMAENLKMAPHIVTFLQDRITNVPESHKLPLFYLMDSIMKNVGGQYIPLFGRKIVELYTDSASQVNEKDCRRLLHVLNTWETQRLFPASDILVMRNAVSRVSGRVIRPPTQLPPRGMANAQMAPRRSPAEIAEDNILRGLLTQLQNDMGIHPKDHMSLEEVRSKNPPFYQQLLAYRSSSRRSAPEPAMPPAPVNYTSARVNAPQPVNQAPAQSSNATQLLQMLKRRSPSPPETPSVSTTKAPDTAAVMSILQKLKGIPNAATSGGGRVSPPMVVPQGTRAGLNPAASTAIARPETAVSTEIKPSKERIEWNIQKLYADLPLLCRQSGVRFTKQSDLDAHLDFLFQYNRSQREKAKGGMSRAWYPNEEQWSTDFHSVEETGDSNKNENDGENADGQFEDGNANGMVLADDSVSKCRICGEPFEKVWNEEEEEWMYKDAVRGTVRAENEGDPENQTIFHKHCYRAALGGSNRRSISSSQLAPGTPQSKTEAATTNWKAATDSEVADGSSSRKRATNDTDSSDVKRVKVE